MYRSEPDRAQGTGPLVTVRTYLDSIAAQLARARLTSEGIEAHVIESASYNPLMSRALGGVQLQVRESDVGRADALLFEKPGDDEIDDGEPDGVIRCPRCELAYCFHERMRVEGNSAATALAVVAAPILLFWPKRWHCHKCGHIWDDPKEGPRAMTPVEPDDPRPVFRLGRAHPGMGLFVGTMAGFLSQLVAQGLASPGRVNGGVVLLVPAFAVIGLVMGRSMRYDVCSEPSCRARLPGDREKCARCHGEIAGAVSTADEHYSAAADFRRELAEERKKHLSRQKKKKAKKKAQKALATP